MNTRIQVEHTVTEMVTGVDLVREQINVAMGMPLSFGPDAGTANGWAIECRINAEDAGRGFAPTPATLTRYVEPVGFGIRVDGAMREGDAVLPQYDSLIAKLIAWGRTRSEAISRLVRGLEDFQIEGPATTIPFHLKLLAHPDFVAGKASTTFLTDHPEVLPIAVDYPVPVPEENGQSQSLALVIEVNGRRFETSIRGLPEVRASVPSNARKKPASSGGRRRGATGAGGDDLASPIQGTVIRVGVENGAEVEAGQLICVVEAMKMENELLAHKAGRVSELSIDVGATVSIGQRLAVITST